MLGHARAMRVSQTVYVRFFPSLAYAPLTSLDCHTSFFGLTQDFSYPPFASAQTTQRVNHD